MQSVHVAANASAENGDGQTHSGALSVIEVEGVVASWFQRHQCSAAIVRPDQYVFGVAANSAELERQIEALSVALDCGNCEHRHARPTTDIKQKEIR
jgi:hypothetical protein